MDVVNCLIALGGDAGNTVPKHKITIAELAVLIAIHGQGPGDGVVSEVELVGTVERSNRAELARVKSRYAMARDGDGNPIVEQVYPGIAARVFEKLDELELPDEAFKDKPSNRRSRQNVEMPPDTIDDADLNPVDPADADGDNGDELKDLAADDENEEAGEQSTDNGGMFE